MSSLTKNVSYDLHEWGVKSKAEYETIHRFAVNQRNLFETVDPIPGAVPALRRLSDDGVWIRVITHRLFIHFFHRVAVEQTTAWLDQYGIPYRDLCFMSEKQFVEADLYIEDSPDNVKKLRKCDKPVVVFTNSTNIDLDLPVDFRAADWREAEKIIRRQIADA